MARDWWDGGIEGPRSRFAWPAEGLPDPPRGLRDHGIRRQADGVEIGREDRELAMGLPVRQVPRLGLGQTAVHDPAELMDPLEGVPEPRLPEASTDVLDGSASSGHVRGSLGAPRLRVHPATEPLPQQRGY